MEMDFGTCTNSGVLSARAVTQCTDMFFVGVAKQLLNYCLGNSKQKKKRQAKSGNMCMVLNCRGKFKKKQGVAAWRTKKGQWTFCSSSAPLHIALGLVLVQIGNLPAGKQPGRASHLSWSCCTYCDYVSEVRKCLKISKKHVLVLPHDDCKVTLCSSPAP